MRSRAYDRALFRPASAPACGAPCSRRAVLCRPRLGHDHDGRLLCRNAHARLLVHPLRLRSAVPVSYTHRTMPGATPVRRSGTMRGSLKTYVFKTGTGFGVRAREFYSLFLEAGAKGGGNPGKRGPVDRRTGRRMRAKGVYKRRVLEPRPFLDTVM